MDTPDTPSPNFSASRVRQWLDTPTDHGRNEPPLGEPQNAVIGEGIDSVIAGKYTLVSKAGVGGFGTVWQARQTQPERIVALKIIKMGMDTPEFIARFEQERQALALMDHPNIAQIFDAGATPSGRPYFVMEWVQGEPITKWCDQHRMTISERLQLFREVCLAVQHAHQKGVLHRDLKPSNILVTEVDGKPVPKLIDFGIAKALGGEAEIMQRSLARSVEGLIIGTPEYMSPEQTGTTPDVDTRSDIYSLGVILYELLTGRTPLGRETLKQAALDEILRLIREAEAPRPSSLFIPITEVSKRQAEERMADPQRLARALRGDLDWVTLKALEKERSRRYETVGSMLNDIDYHLRDEPVSAGPPGMGYRLSKNLRKHRAAWITATTLTVVLIAATAVSLWQAKEAERARDLANTERDRAEVAQKREKEARDYAETERIKAIEERDGANEARKAEEQARKRAESAEAQAVTERNTAVKALAALKRERVAAFEALLKWLEMDGFSKSPTEHLSKISEGEVVRFVVPVNVGLEYMFLCLSTDQPDLEVDFSAFDEVGNLLPSMGVNSRWFYWTPTRDNQKVAVAFVNALHGSGSAQIVVLRRVVR